MYIFRLFEILLISQINTHKYLSAVCPLHVVILYLSIALAAYICKLFFHMSSTYNVSYSYVTFSRIIGIVLNLDDEWRWAIGFVDWVVETYVIFILIFATEFFYFTPSRET